MDMNWITVLAITVPVGAAIILACIILSRRGPIESQEPVWDGYDDQYLRKRSNEQLIMLALSDISNCMEDTDANLASELQDRALADQD